jgi:ketosteroid isomerase-like protein
MSISTREAFERGTDTFNAHDVEGFKDLMADDVVFEAPGGMRGEGKEACGAFYGGWLAAFPDAHVDVRGVHIVDDVAVEEGVFTGTHDGVLHLPTGDIPPTGRSVAVHYIQVIRYRDGKHASFHLMFDRLLMLEQLGLVPDPAAAG